MKSQLLIFLLVLNSVVSYSQNFQKQDDDSLKFYKDIEKRAKKGKVSYWLYNEIFNLPNSHKDSEHLQKRVSYAKYSGKIIRNIFTSTLDPFGYSVTDSSVVPTSFIQKGGNVLHQKTKRIAVLNQLLFRSGDALDPLKIKESERIMRQTPQVREVEVYVVPVKSTDSVDVYIREQDYWSKGFGLQITKDRYHFLFSDKNFLGFNHNFQNDISYDPDSGRYVDFGTYSIPYIRNTLLIPTISYSTDPYTFVKGVGISRPFITPLIKWAGSAEIYDIKTSGYSVFPELDTVRFSTRFFSKDFWLARSFSLAPDSSEETRSTRLIFGARYRNVNYFYHAPDIIQPSFFFEDMKQYLVSVGLSNRTYYRDFYIYRYGVQEDVPAGRLLVLTAGYEDKETRDRFYGGINASSGNHFDSFGYLSLNVGLGSYLWKGHWDQSIFKIGIGYFSDLLEFKNIRFRQFVKASVTYGFNRVEGENLNLNNDIRGFDSEGFFGQKKAVVSLQTQAYLPWQFIGFRFAPFFYINGGLLSVEDRPLNKSRFYQAYGIGLLIKNELLVINTFQFAIGFYPYIPGNESMFRFNPLKTYDFSFQDFIFDRPSVLPLE